MKIEIDRPLDMHLHLRDGAMLRLVAPHTARDFAGAVVMPNLVPPVDSVGAMRDYRSRVLAAAGTPEEKFSPLMTIFLKRQTPAELEAAKAEPGFFAMKLYPAGATTNSDGGVRDFGEAEPTLRAMEALGIPLLVHGESGGFVVARGADFLLDEGESLSATVTLHPLLFTLDDVAGGLLAPHLSCKPIVKRPEDRAALREAVFRGHPKRMFGGDSAPHPVAKKECAAAAGGIYYAPFALPALARLFAENGALDRLGDFVGGNARRVWGLPAATEKIVLEDAPQKVPEVFEGEDGVRVVPLFAGTEIGWRRA